MRKLLLIVIVALFAIQGQADNVTFTVSDGIDNAAIKSKIESEVSRMLSEINAAQEAGRSLNFSAMGNIGTRVQQSMAMLWENSPFVCTDEDVIKSNLELTDLRRRQLILDYVEQFRTAYNQKDINFLNQVFSDDALIITGKVITTKHAEGFTSQKIQYNKQSKEQYIKNLRGVFARNSYIKVTFDEIEVMRHPVNPNFYGVTLLQGWTSGKYHDDGYLFLLWDFTNESAPQIHVRTWQPDKIGGKSLPKDEVFSLSDFDI